MNTADVSAGGVFASWVLVRLVLTRCWCDFRSASTSTSSREDLATPTTARAVCGSGISEGSGRGGAICEGYLSGSASDGGASDSGACQCIQ